MDRSVTVYLRAVVAPFQAGYHSAGRSVDELTTKVIAADAKSKQNLQSLSRGMLLVGGAAVAGVGLAVSQFVQFDKQMSNVKAVTNATTGELDDLRDAAIKAGAATVFNAKDAASAEAELAKAGVSVRDILGGGLTGALNLAAAGEIDVADAANIAATAMVQFGKDGSAVPHIADLLAASANKAQGGVQDMATALKYVGPVAHQMGVSLEETVGTIAELANNGILADQAGTSLRGMLSALTSPSHIAAKEMQTLGINVYDAQGQFIGFRGVAEVLQDRLGRLTIAERDQALGRIFGNEQITAARILYAGGAADVDKWTKAVNDTGAAERIAHTNLDNLAGDFEQLKGSLQTDLIQSGSQANGVLRDLTQGATGVVNEFGQLPGPVQGGATALVAVGGGAVAALGGIGLLIPKVKQGRAALNELGTAGQFADRNLGRLGRLGGYAAVIAAVGISLGALGNKIDDLTGHSGPELDQLTRSLVKLAQTGQVTGAALELIGHGAGQLKDDLGTLDGLSGTIGHLASASSFGLADREWVRAKNRVDDLDKALAGLVQQGYDAQAKQIFALIAAQVVAGGGSVSDLKGKLNDYSNALANADTQQSLAGDSATGLGNDLSTIVSPAVQEATDSVDDYKKSLDDLNNVNISAARAKIALRQAYKDATKAANDSAGVTDKEKSSLLDLADQANSTAAAIIDQTGDQDKASASMRAARGEFIAVAEKMGYTHDKAKALADAWLQIPTKRNTTYTTSGLGSAQSDADRLLATLRAIPNHVPISVTIGIAGKIPHIPVDGARAMGGWTPPGSYWVGERGPELFTTAVPGTVTPAHATAAVLAHGGPLTAANSAQGGPIMRDLIVYTREDGRVIEDIPRALDAQVYRMRGR